MEFATKEIYANGRQRRIVMQNENGPCPLLAIANCLILMDGLEVTQEVLSSEWLVDELGARAGPQLAPFVDQLLLGLDANPVFDGTFKGEAGHVFGLFGLQLVHGWVMPHGELYDRTLSYEELTAKLTLAEPDGTALAGEQFLETYPLQISPEGEGLLAEQMSEGDITVLFRNNHYSTIVKRDRLYTLVTDVGFASYGDIVWEDLKGGFYEANMSERQDCSKDEEIARNLQQQLSESRTQNQSAAPRAPRATHAPPPRKTPKSCAIS